MESQSIDTVLADTERKIENQGAEESSTLPFYFGTLPLSSQLLRLFPCRGFFMTDS